MARPKKKAENEVIKASAAIQINGRVTLLQRRAWNVLLAHAYDELPHKDRHSIQIANLMHTLEFDSKNDDYFKEALKSLVHCSVEWNLLDKDGHTEWGVAALLAEAKITRGICIYAYGPTLRERLYSPAMYARLSLLLQNRFESKHALGLWELCTDYLGAKRDYGETPWIPLEDFRKLMGIEDSNYYTVFKHLQQKIVTPAVTEIGHVSDFNVIAEYQRIGRKVTALKFKIRRVVLLLEPSHSQAPLFPELDNMPPLVRELKDAGLSTQDALQIWQQGFEFVDVAQRPKDTGMNLEEAFAAYVREKIHLLKRRQSSGKVDNSTGFLREAIKKNYSNPEYEIDEQKEARKATQKAAAIEQSRAATMEERKAIIQRRHEEEIQALCNRIVEEFPAFLEHTVTWAMENTKGFDFVYKPSKTALENYRDSIALRAMLNPYLERQHPAGFEEIRTRYNRELAELPA